MLKIYKTNLIAIFNSHIVSYGTPVNLNYIWSLGAMAGILMIIQVISGTFLCMHYLSDSFESFSSLNWIMADVPYGYAVRHLHWNGASMFFIVVYGHIAKAPFVFGGVILMVFYFSFFLFFIPISGIIEVKLSNCTCAVDEQCANNILLAVNTLIASSFIIVQKYNLQAEVVPGYIMFFGPWVQWVFSISVLACFGLAAPLPASIVQLYGASIGCYIYAGFYSEAQKLHSSFLSPLEQFEVLPLFSWNNASTIFNFIITNEWIFLVLIFFFTSIIFLASTKKSSRNTLYLVPNRYNVIFNFLEKLVSSLVKENIKDLSAARAFPFIFCIFIFLICLNMIGMIPYSFTLTSHIAISLNLSLTAFIMINILAIRKYGLKMFSLFLPGGTSVILALLLVPIEVVSFCFKPISLSIRLFANLMAGHTLLKVIAGFAYTLSTAGGFLWLVSFVPLLILMPLFFLEFAVALIQAFVFTVLICIYYSDSNNISH